MVHYGCMKTKPNLLIAGASGAVSNAFLHHLISYRNLFGKLVLVDRNKRVLEDIYIDHKRLDYTFVHTELNFYEPEKKAEYHKLLREYGIEIVLDLTDEDSLPFWHATDELGISYINTCQNDDVIDTEETVMCVLEQRDEVKNAPHIMSSGMNPGVVNMWVRHGIEKFGVPKEIVHFEYDTSKIAKQWQPMMTWSLHEFLEECTRDKGGLILGRGRENIKGMYPNALEHRKSMREILSPIMKLDTYPEGTITMHDECVSIGNKYDIPSQFLYAINPQTMQALIKIYEEKGAVTQDDLVLGDNTNQILDGSDNIGLFLEYPDKRVYYFNTVSSVALIGTSATMTQVIIGVFAAVFVLLFDDLDRKTYFVEELYDTYYRHFLFDNMRVQEYVFKKGEHGHLKLTNFVPMIRSHKSKKYEHLYII